MVGLCDGVFVTGAGLGRVVCGASVDGALVGLLVDGQNVTGVLVKGADVTGACVTGTPVMGTSVTGCRDGVLVGYAEGVRVVGTLVGLLVSTWHQHPFGCGPPSAKRNPETPNHGMSHICAQ